MVKNITGGNKAKKGKRGGRLTKNPTKEFDTENGIYFYGQVKGKLGGNVIEVLLQTGETIHAIIPGRFMRKVWFNKDDLIVVSNETANFYDVIQKITNPVIQIEAMSALNIKFDKDDSQIFRTNEEDEDIKENDESEKIEQSKAELNAIRRKKDKERDLNRRNENEGERIISVITNNETESNETESNETESNETESNETESNETEILPIFNKNIEEEKVIPEKKPIIIQKNIKKTVAKNEELKKPVKRIIHYQETEEETKNFLGL
jgi:translation initiation factor IF-1